MKKLISVFLLVLALLIPSGTAYAASSSDIMGCKVTRGGVGSWNGEWVKVICDGPKFTKPKKYGKHQYRAFAWCDRVGWQADRKDVGSWQWGRGTSIAYCDAIGDWGAVRWGYEWR